jgi:hypothetical protein
MQRTRWDPERLSLKLKFLSSMKVGGGFNFMFEGKIVVWL